MDIIEFQEQYNEGNQLFIALRVKLDNVRDLAADKQPAKAIALFIMSECAYLIIHLV